MNLLIRWHWFSAKTAWRFSAAQLHERQRRSIRANQCKFCVAPKLSQEWSSCCFSPRENALKRPAGKTSRAHHQRQLSPVRKRNQIAARFGQLARHRKPFTRPEKMLHLIACCSVVKLRITRLHILAVAFVVGSLAEPAAAIWRVCNHCIEAAFWQPSHDFQSVAVNKIRCHNYIFFGWFLISVSARVRR